jgi:PAS domain S-box-containing protein
MTKDLKQSEEKYKSIFESLQDVFYRTDKEGNVTTVSPSIYNYIGKTPETLIGKPATDFYKNPNDRASMIKELQKKGQLKDYPLTLKGSNDKEIFVSLNARFLKNEKGEILGVEGLLRDVTERKIAEDAVKERTKELERMNSLMIGRELRMIELKKQLAEKKEQVVSKVKKHAKKK